MILAHALRGGGGISVGQNLVRALVDVMPEAHFWATIPQGCDYEGAIGLSHNVHYISFQKKSHFHQWWYETFEAPGFVRTMAADIVISLGNRALRGVPCPQIMLLHDAHLFYPTKYYAGESASRKLLKQLQRYRLARDLRRIDTLLVQTKIAEKRVREYFKYSGRTEQVPNSISRFVAVGVNHPVPDVFHRHSACLKLFYLTRYYPHKNIEILIDLFERFPEKTENVRLFLTIDAEQHRGAKKLLKRIGKSGLHGKIINLGPLKQGQLGQYYCHCDALVMPSTLESYSATYLEAMAFGTPILTSDLDFAKEICGDSAYYFDPWNVESLASTLDMLNENPAFLSELTRKGRARLKHLSVDWSASGRRLAELVIDLSRHDACNHQ